MAKMRRRRGHSSSSYKVNYSHHLIKPERLHSLVGPPSPLYMQGVSSFHPLSRLHHVVCTCQSNTTVSPTPFDCSLRAMGTDVPLCIVHSIIKLHTANCRVRCKMQHSYCPLHEHALSNPAHSDKTAYIFTRSGCSLRGRPWPTPYLSCTYLVYSSFVFLRLLCRASQSIRRATGCQPNQACSLGQFPWSSRKLASSSDGFGLHYLDSSLTQHCHTTPTICLELQVIQLQRKSRPATLQRLKLVRRYTNGAGCVGSDPASSLEKVRHCKLH